jgi:hypothetical protein
MAYGKARTNIKWYVVSKKDRNILGISIAKAGPYNSRKEAMAMLERKLKKDDEAKVGDLAVASRNIAAMSPAIAPIEEDSHLLSTDRINLPDFEEEVGEEEEEEEVDDEE